MKHNTCRSAAVVTQGLVADTVATQRDSWVSLVRLWFEGFAGCFLKPAGNADSSAQLDSATRSSMLACRVFPALSHSIVAKRGVGWDLLPPESSERLYGLENVTKNHSTESSEQQPNDKFEFRWQNLSLGQTRGSSCSAGMHVAFGTRNHSPQNLPNRPTGALAFLIPCRPPFWSRGCSAQGHGWKCHCCFAVVFLSLSKQHGYNYCRPSSAHARGWLSCSHCVCAPVCCYKGCGLDV